MALKMAEPEPQLRRNTFFEITLIEEIAVESWRALFDATEYPGKLTSRSLTKDSVSEALTNELLSEDLLNALLMNLELGTDAGVEAIRSEADAQKIDMSSWPADESARELVMRLWIGALADADISDVLERAQMSVHAGKQRTVREFTGKEPGRPRSEDMRTLRPKIRGPIATYCETKGMSDFCEVRGCVREDGICFEVIHGYRMQKPSVIQDQKRTVLPYRPAHCDSLRYEPDTGRLTIAARAAVMVTIYRETLGRVLFNDDQYFKGDLTCVLEPLQTRRQAALDAHNMHHRITRARLVECTWERGEKSRVSLRDEDCFAVIQKLKLPIGEGDLVYAKIELMLEGRDRSRSGRRVVTVTPPNRINVPDELVKAEIHDYLDQIGVRFRSLTTPELDLWSLAPWLHHESRWLALYSDGVDRFKREKILVPRRLERVTHPDHPNHVGALRVEVTQRAGKDTFHGVSTDEDVPSRELTPSEVSGLRLDEKQLVQAVAKALELTGASREVTTGVWDLGERSLGKAKIHVFMATREPTSKDTTQTEAITRRAGSGRSAVLLVPEGRTAELGIPEARWPFPTASYDGLMAVIIDTLDLKKIVPAVIYAPAKACLVVDRGFNKIWVNRNEMTALRPDTQPFKFTRLVAEADGKPLDTKELDKELGRTGAAKEAKADAVTAMRKSFNEADLPEPDMLGKIFRNVRGSYTLGVEGFVA